MTLYTAVPMEIFAKEVYDIYHLKTRIKTNLEIKNKYSNLSINAP